MSLTKTSPKRPGLRHRHRSCDAGLSPSPQAMMHTTPALDDASEEFVEIEPAVSKVASKVASNVAIDRIRQTYGTWHGTWKHFKKQ